MEIQVVTTLRITHLIKGHENYGIVNGDGVYSFRRGRKLKKQLKGYTVGYYLDRGFYSIKQIKQLAIPLPKYELPF